LILAIHRERIIVVANVDLKDFILLVAFNELKQIHGLVIVELGQLIYIFLFRFLSIAYGISLVFPLNSKLG